MNAPDTHAGGGSYGGGAEHICEEEEEEEEAGPRRTHGRKKTGQTESLRGDVRAISRRGKREAYKASLA